MNGNDVIQGQPALRNAAATALMFLLWVASSALGLLALFALRDILIWGVGALLTQTSSMPSYEIAKMVNLANQCGAIIVPSNVSVLIDALLVGV